MLLTEFRYPLLHKLGVLYGGAAYGDHVSAASERGLQVGAGLDAAAEVNGQVGMSGD